MYNKQKKALTRFYLKTGPKDTHTNTQKMDLSGSSISRAGPGYLSRLVRSHRPEPPRWTRTHDLGVASTKTVDHHCHDLRLSTTHSSTTTHWLWMPGWKCLTHDDRLLGKRHDFCLSTLVPTTTLSSSGGRGLFCWPLAS